VGRGPRSSGLLAGDATGFVRRIRSGRNGTTTIDRGEWLEAASSLSAGRWLSDGSVRSTIGDWGSAPSAIVAGPTVDEG